MDASDIELLRARLYATNPKHSPGDAHQRDAQVRDPLNISFTRRSFIGAVGMSTAIAAFPAGAGIRPAEFQARSMGNRFVFFKDNIPIWTIDPAWFDGRSRLITNISTDQITVELREAKYPGTSLPADFKADLVRLNDVWRIAFSSKYGLSASTDLQGWLTGESALRGEVRSPRLSFRIPGEGLIAIAGPAVATVSPALELSLVARREFKAQLSGLRANGREITLRVKPAVECGTAAPGHHRVAGIFLPSVTLDTLSCEMKEIGFNLGSNVTCGLMANWECSSSGVACGVVELEGGVAHLNLEPRGNSRLISTKSKVSAWHHSRDVLAPASRWAFASRSEEAADFIHLWGLRLSAQRGTSIHFEAAFASRGFADARLIFSDPNINLSRPGFVCGGFRTAVPRGIELVLVGAHAGHLQNLPEPHDVIWVESGSGSICNEDWCGTTISEIRTQMHLGISWKGADLRKPLFDDWRLMPREGERGYLRFTLPSQITVEDISGLDPPRSRQSSSTLGSMLRAFSKLVQRADTVPPRYVQAGVSHAAQGGASFLVFSIPREGILFNIESLTNVDDLRPSTDLRASDSEDDVIPSGTGRPLVPLNGIPITEPSDTSTAIRAAWKMRWSPNEKSQWRRPLELSGRVELWNFGLYSEKGSRNPGGKIRALWADDVGSGNYDVTPSQVDGCPSTMVSTNGQSDFPLTLLSTEDRRELVQLTSRFGAAASYGNPDVRVPRAPEAPRNPDDGTYVPKQITAHYMQLGALGASYSVDIAWDKYLKFKHTGASDYDIFDVVGYKSRVALGSINAQEVEYAGYLIPFGFPVSLIKREVRTLVIGADGEPVAMPVYHQVLRFRNASAPWPGVGHPFSKRGWPFRFATILMKETEDIDCSDVVVNSSADKCADGLNAFWVREGTSVPGAAVTTNPLLYFEFRIEDKFTVRLPMIFVPVGAADNLNSLREIVKKYNDDSWPSGEVKRSFCAVDGSRVVYAKPSSNGGTDFPTTQWKLLAKLPDPENLVGSLLLYSVNEIGIFPHIQFAKVSVPAVEHLSGAVSSTIGIAFDPVYLDRGFDSKQNTRCVFATTTLWDEELGKGNPLLLSLGRTDRAGALARPDIQVVGFSQRFGPIGGSASGAPNIVNTVAWRRANGRTATPDVNPGADDMNAFRNGTVNFANFFSSNANLLGIVPLSEILSGSQIDSSTNPPSLIDETIDGIPASSEDEATSSIIATLDAIRDLVTAISTAIADASANTEAYASEWTHSIQIVLDSINAATKAIQDASKTADKVSKFFELAANLRSMDQLLSDLSIDPGEIIRNAKAGVLHVVKDPLEQLAKKLPQDIVAPLQKQLRDSSLNLFLASVDYAKTVEMSDWLTQSLAPGINALVNVVESVNSFTAASAAGIWEDYENGLSLLAPGITYLSGLSMGDCSTAVASKLVISLTFPLKSLIDVSDPNNIFAGLEAALAAATSDADKRIAQQFSQLTQDLAGLIDVLGKNWIPSGTTPTVLQIRTAIDSLLSVIKKCVQILDLARSSITSSATPSSFLRGLLDAAKLIVLAFMGDALSDAQRIQWVMSSTFWIDISSTCAANLAFRDGAIKLSDQIDALITQLKAATGPSDSLSTAADDTFASLQWMSALAAFQMDSVRAAAAKIYSNFLEFANSFSGVVGVLNGVAKPFILEIAKIRASVENTLAGDTVLRPWFPGLADLSLAMDYLIDSGAESAWCVLIEALSPRAPTTGVERAEDAGCWPTNKPRIGYLISGFISVVTQILSRPGDVVLDAIRNQLSNVLATLVPTNQRLSYSVTLPLNSTQIFIPDTQPTTTALTLSAMTNVDLLRVANSSATVEGKLGPFGINIDDFILVHFSHASFISIDGAAPRFSCDIDNVVPRGNLKAIEDLAEIFGAKAGLFLEIEPTFVTTGIRLPVPYFDAVVFEVVDLNLEASLKLPFDGTTSVITLSISDSTNPFEIIAGIYGGGGYFEGELKTINGGSVRDGTKLSASFEYGAMVEKRYGPLTAAGAAVIGMSFAYSSETTLFSFFFIGGHLTVCGFDIGAASLRVTLAFEVETGEISGQAQYSFTFGFAFFSVTYTATVTEVLQHGKSAARSNVARASTPPSVLTSYRDSPLLCNANAWRTYLTAFELDVLQ